jgi:hypothetical protein
VVVVTISTKDFTRILVSTVEAHFAALAASVKCYGHAKIVALISAVGH